MNKEEIFRKIEKLEREAELADYEVMLELEKDISKLYLELERLDDADKDTHQL